jgi:Na+-driven multidrug efflux pump
MFTGMGIGIVIGIVIYLGIYFRGNVLAGLFSTDQAAVQNGWDYLKGFAPEAIVTAVLFSYNGYFNGHDRTVFIMISGILQTFAVRLPLAYYESIQVNASLTKIGFAAPCATCFGIVLCVIYDRLFMHQLKAQKKNNGMMTVSR